MLTKLEEIINQITEDTGIPKKNLLEKLESFLKLLQKVLQKVPKLPEHPKTLIEQLTDDQELNRKAIGIYYSSLIETLRKFVNILAYHWKTAQSTTQSPETITNMRQVILEEFINFLTSIKKEHTHLLRHIAELEDYSGKFEKADEYIFKVIWQDIQDGSLDEEATKDLAVLLANSSGDYKSRLLLLKERCSKLLKEPTLVIQKIEKLEKVIAQKEFIKNASEKIRQTTLEIKETTKTERAGLENLSLKVENLCKHMDVIGNLIEETKEEILIPLNKINDECLETILKVASKMPNKKLAKEYTRLLLKINDRLLKYFSSKDSKRFMNLFDRIEYLRLHKSLWDEYRFRECIKEAYELGKKICESISSYNEYSDHQKLEAFLGKFGEICRNMVEFEVCEHTQKRDLLLRSIDLLQKSLIRDGKPIIKYFGRNCPRIGRNYMDLRQWKDAIKWFMEINDIDETKKVDKKIAFEARIKIADCYLNLGLEARKYGDIDGASQCFKFAEEFYNKADEFPKLSPEDGIHLVGKKADFYYISQQYDKALPLYKEIMQRASSAPPDEKNLYDCFSYRLGECLYWIREIDESIEQFKTTLNCHPEKEHKIKSYGWLIKLYSIKQERDKLNEITTRILNDQEIKGIALHGISTEKLDVLLLPHKMEVYIAQIDDRLARGDQWAVIDELRDMIRLHKLLEGHDDAVLLTKIAQAYTRARDYDSALKTLFYVMKLDSGPENQAQALSYIGRVYMEQGEYQKAISAFQESFELGGDIGMLLLQATAYRKLKEYDLSIRKYEQILGSGKDKRPHITKTGLVKTYWDKYQHESKKEDIESALSYLKDVINGYPKDWKSCDLLVRISKDTAIYNSLESLISEGAVTAVKNILKGLTAEDLFPEKAIMACLKRLSLIAPSDIEYWSFVQSSVDFLMRATIYSYFFSDEDSFNGTLRTILSGILSLSDWNNVMREYLCAEKGAYVDFFEKIYAMQISAILEPILRENVDVSSIPGVIQSVKDFIQSEIPQGIKVLYKGLETKGVDFTSMLMSRFGEVEVQEENYILKHLINIQPSVEIPYPSWYMFEKLTDWFYPIYSNLGWYSKGIWGDIFSEAAKIIVNLKTHENDKIECHFIAELFYTDEKRESFMTAFEAVKNKHGVCPIPPMPWFRYLFGESLLEEKNQGILTVVIEMPRCVKDSFQRFSHFLNYMISSFIEGLRGNFKREEYRKMATELFPSDISMNLGQWMDFVHIYLDHHFSVLFDACLRDDQYRDAVHDYIKGPLEYGKISEQKEIIDFLANVERLPWELGHVRRRKLESITTKSSIHKLDMEKILEQLMDDIQDKNPEINFEFFPSKCRLVDGVEPLLKRSFMALYNNAIFATKASNGSKISTFIFEEGDYCIIRIQNPFKDPTPPSPFSTQIGLKSARSIIENEHNGILKTSGNTQQGVYTTEVKLPFNIHK